MVSEKITLDNYNKLLCVENINDISWSPISRYMPLAEDFMDKFKNYLDWFSMSVVQELSEDFIIKHEKYVKMELILRYQNLSSEFKERYKDKAGYCKLVKSVHHCGFNNRCIYINDLEPNKINIGCFNGTKEEAIKAVSKKYVGVARDKYIAKIEECFNYKRDNK